MGVRLRIRDQGVFPVEKIRWINGGLTAAGGRSRGGSRLFGSVQAIQAMLNELCQEYPFLSPKASRVVTRAGRFVGRAVVAGVIPGRVVPVRRAPTMLRRRSARGGAGSGFPR